MSDTTQPLPAALYARQSQGRTKSIEEQLAECRADAERAGYRIVAEFDDRTSASRFGRRPRGGNSNLMAEIQASRIAVVVVWAPDRADRELESWARFLNACRQHRILIRVTDHDRTYDLDNPRDWRALAEDGIDSAYFSEKLSRSIRRGVKGAATAGRPPMGPCPYGYVRVYDQRTGRLLGQEPDPATAPIVREIFTRVVRSVPLSKIADDLNERKITPPGVRSHQTGSVQWYRERIRKIATNPAYIAKRHHGGELHDADWDPLVDEEVFWSARRVLEDVTRWATVKPLGPSRPGRQVHLLTYLATCGVCEQGVRGKETFYACAGGHVSIRRQPVDDLVRDVLLARIAKPDAYRHLRQLGDEADREVVAAQAEVARLERDLDDWRRSATDGRGTTPATLAVIEADLARQIKAARTRASRAGLHPALRQLLGPDAPLDLRQVDLLRRWNDAPVTARREVIRAMCEVQIQPSGRNAFMPVHERVAIIPRSWDGV